MSKHGFSDEIDSINAMLVRVGRSGLVDNLGAAALLAYAIEERWCSAVASLGLDDADVLDVFRDTMIDPPLNHPEFAELRLLLWPTQDSDCQTADDVQLEEVPA